MTSSSATEIRFALALALVAGGCAAQPVEETQALVLAESLACRMATTRGDQINHYHAVLYEMMGPNPDENSPPCANCIGTPRCRAVDEACGCTEPHPPSTAPMNRHLSGLGFFDVTPQRPYCIAMIGVDDPASTTAPGDPSHACDCVDPRTTSITSCGVTPFPGVAEDNAGAVFVFMECGGACALAP